MAKASYASIKDTAANLKVDTLAIYVPSEHVSIERPTYENRVRGNLGCDPYGYEVKPIRTYQSSGFRDSGPITSFTSTPSTNDIMSITHAQKSANGNYYLHNNPAPSTAPKGSIMLRTGSEQVPHSYIHSRQAESDALTRILQSGEVKSASMPQFLSTLSKQQQQTPYIYSITSKHFDTIAARSTLRNPTDKQFAAMAEKGKAFKPSPEAKWGPSVDLCTTSVGDSFWAVTPRRK